MKKRFIFIGVLLISLFLNAQEYQLAEAKVTFKIKNAGISVDGTFDSIRAILDLEKNEWHQASLSGKIRASTIDTGIRLRDKHLRNEDYFDVENFPYIKMHSTHLKKVNNQTLYGTFILNIKNIEKEVKIPMDFSKNGNIISLKGEIIINRQDFELGEDSVILSDNVTIQLLLTFKSI
jgi:polyisoprenoid-binding protein YceI